MCDAFPALLLDLAVCTVAQRYHLCQRRQELTAIFEARVHAAVRVATERYPAGPIALRSRATHRIRQANLKIIS